jgi:hypothetical protein
MSRKTEERIKNHDERERAPRTDSYRPSDCNDQNGPADRRERANRRSLPNGSEAWLNSEVELADERVSGGGSSKRRGQ